MLPDVLDCIAVLRGVTFSVIVVAFDVVRLSLIVVASLSLDGFLSHFH